MMKLSFILILCVLVGFCKADDKDSVLKQPWRECAPQYGLDPGNYAFVMNAKNRGATGCAYKKIGLFKEDGKFNYDYKLSYPKVPGKPKLESILNRCINEAYDNFDKLATCYKRETEGIVRKY